MKYNIRAWKNSTLVTDKMCNSIQQARKIGYEAVEKDCSPVYIFRTNMEFVGTVSFAKYSKKYVYYRSGGYVYEINRNGRVITNKSNSSPFVKG